MEQKKSEHKKKLKIYNRPILSLLVGMGFITVIMLFAIITAAKNDNNNLSYLKFLNSNQATPTAAAPDKLLAVVKVIDADLKKIALYDVNEHKTLELSYNGGTNITDKYGKLMSMSQVEIGSMVDIAYQKDKQKLTDMNISSKAWEYVGVNNFTTDLTAMTMKIASTYYKYGDDVVVLNGEDFVPITTLTEQDELTVRGYEETILSITVTRGHGTVVLEDYDTYLGDFITIGYEAMQQIAKDMEITVREGNFDLTVDTGEYSASKNITVKRNEVTTVSLSDLGPAATGFGHVNFKITPFGADLYIDGALTSYANTIELKYGDHTIVTSMGGYTTYNGTLTVDSAGKTIKIDLPESSSQDAVTVTETDGSTGAPAGSTDTPTSSPDVTPGGTDTTTTGGTTGSNTDAGHTISVQKPSGASVYIDGVYKCIAPGSFTKMTGSHVITFIKDGYKTMSYTIEVEDDGLDTTFTFPDLSEE